jgi:hypothetical protein
VWNLVFTLGLKALLLYRFLERLLIHRMGLLNNIKPPNNEYIEVIPYITPKGEKGFCNIFSINNVWCLSEERDLSRHQWPNRLFPSPTPH